MPRHLHERSGAFGDNLLWLLPGCADLGLTAISFHAAIGVSISIGITTSSARIPDPGSLTLVMLGT